MRCAVLASGSKGNAALVEHQDHLVLVDCGLSLRQLRARMATLQVQLSDLTAIFITHEHSDHILGLAKVVAATGLVPHMTLGTANQLGLRKDDFIKVAASSPVAMGAGFAAAPFTIPHDAAEPVHYCFEAGSSKFAFATDIGEPNDYIAAQIADCSVIGIESNYDPAMLEQSAYPAFVKNRIRGRHGHLSNHDAGSLLQKIGNGRIRIVLAMHLSENNNTPERVKTTLDSYLSYSANAPRLIVCSQHEPTAWVEIPQLN